MISFFAIFGGMKLRVFTVIYILTILRAVNQIAFSMAHNPILNAYRLRLKPTKDGDKIKFSDLMARLSNADEKDDGAQLFMDFFGKFLDKLRADEFVQNPKKQKAFTGYNLTQAEGRDANIMPDWEKHVIEGVVDGGRYGQARSIAKLEKKKEKSPVDISQIITDQYYFYLYTPLDSDLAVLILQSYTEDSIADVFLPFVMSTMKVEKFTFLPESESVMPNSVVEKYKENSKIKSYKYTRRVPSNTLYGEHVEDDHDEITIKIEITSKNGKPISSKEFWRKIFGNTTYGLGSKNRTKLSSFDEEKAVLQGTENNRQATWDIKKNFDLMPTQYLEGIIDIDNKGIPNFGQLKSYCEELLEEMKPEIYGSKYAKRPNF